MTISKTRLGLLALPLLATGVIGVAALSTSHGSAATPSPTQAATSDKPEPNDTADAPDPTDVNEPKGAADTDNIQDGPQGNAQDNQADGEDPNR